MGEANTQIVIDEQTQGVVTLLPDPLNNRVMVWFENLDGECAHDFTPEKWDELDKAVRASFKKS